MGNLVIKAIVWNVWLARNDHVFNANTMSAFDITLKVDRILLSWFYAITNGSKEKLEGSMALISKSLDFLGSHAAISGEIPTPEEDHDLNLG